MTNARAEALPTASSASALDSLLNEYRTLATSEREKGAMFEELTRQFLLHDARFAHQFKEVYLWSEWPERQTGDTGIDLVAIPADEKRKNPGSDVDYGEDRAPMRRQGLTGLNTRPPVGPRWPGPGVDHGFDLPALRPRLGLPVRRARCALA